MQLVMGRSILLIILSTLHRLFTTMMLLSKIKSIVWCFNPPIPYINLGSNSMLRFWGKWLGSMPLKIGLFISLAKINSVLKLLKYGTIKFWLLWKMFPFIQNLKTSLLLVMTHTSKNDSTLIWLLFTYHMNPKSLNFQRLRVKKNRSSFKSLNKNNFNRQ